MLEGYRSSTEAVANSVPGTLPPLVALAIVALLSGVSKLIDQGASPEEYDVIKDALENADRYYKVMAGPGENNKTSEEAFKQVSLMWLARRQVAARFAGALSSFEIFYLGMLWLETGDLAAPLVAAMAMNGVDFVSSVCQSAQRKLGHADDGIGQSSDFALMINSNFVVLIKTSFMIRQSVSQSFSQPVLALINLPSYPRLWWRCHHRRRPVDPA